MPRAALLFNPRAGQGRGARCRVRIAAELRQEYELDELPADSPKQLRAQARSAAERGFDAVFVLGGDGTLRLAASELLGTATALGALPGGTTNVVAGALGLPADPVAAARVLVHSTAREIDVVRAGADVYLMQVSGGLDARVMTAVDADWKRRLGKLAIAWTGLREWARYRFPPFGLEIDGEPAAATGFVAVNLSHYAGPYQIVPGARADDRQIELLLFHGRRRRAALGFALDLARGRHTSRPDVEVRRVERVRLTAPARLELQGDGDPFAENASFEIRLSSRRLRLLAPEADG